VWVGSLIDHGKPIIVIADEGKEKEAILRLARVGYEHVFGYLDGGFDSWIKAGKNIEVVESIEPEVFAEELGIEIFSSPFDKTAVDFLENLGISMYKIASMESGDIPLIKYVAKTQKPIIASTGSSTLEEIDELDLNTLFSEYGVDSLIVNINEDENIVIDR
jgi:hypothetical protein